MFTSPKHPRPKDSLGLSLLRGISANGCGWVCCLHKDWTVVVKFHNVSAMGRGCKRFCGKYYCWHCIHKRPQTFFIIIWWYEQFSRRANLLVVVGWKLNYLFLWKWKFCFSKPLWMQSVNQLWMDNPHPCHNILFWHFTKKGSLPLGDLRFCWQFDSFFGWVAQMTHGENSGLDCKCC